MDKIQFGLGQISLILIGQVFVVGMIAAYHTKPTHLCLRTLRGTADSGVDLSGKVKNQILLVILVPIDGPKEFLFGLQVKIVVHASNRFQTLAKTSSPGIGFTSPDRNSARRR